MILLENTVTASPEQWRAAIMGARNPMNSWDKSDSEFWPCHMNIGENDLGLMKRLVAAGTDHSKFMRFLPVTVDVTAPLYWWKEMDTYKVGTVANSCSTMHKIQAKEFTMLDFSEDKLLLGIPKHSDHIYDDAGNDITMSSQQLLGHVINHLNVYRKLYLETKDNRYWWQMIQLLPSSYNQKRTMMLNYAVLRNIYFARRDHKLDEWHDFCKWIEKLPFSELITLEK